MATSSRPSPSPSGGAFAAALLVGLALTLGACSGRGAAEPYHRTTPVELYIYTPPNYQAGVPIELLLALHGPNDHALDCFQAWKRYADENGFALLCPELPYSDGRLDRTAAQSRIGGALAVAYQEASLHNTFFVTGFGEAGTLALSYASQFPQAITGVAAIASNEFPALTPDAASLPILILAMSGDPGGGAAAQAFADALVQQGRPIRLVMLDERGDRLTRDDLRLTVEFMRQILQ